MYEQSILLARDVGDGWLISAATNNLGNVYMREGDYERAIELFEESLAIGEERGDLDRRARELTNLGHARHELGELDRAGDLFRSGLAASAEIGLFEIELSAMWGIASCQADAGDTVTAARLLGWITEGRARLGVSGDEYDLALEETVREALGQERFTSELVAGAALGREGAIDLALGRAR